MEEREIRKEVTEVGRQLLKDGLVARTWGNVSARLDSQHFLITPSGLDYMQTKDEDLALYNPADKTWTGPHKPSSEKGIHAAAYDIFPEVNFVIHTHQSYASAIGLAGFDSLDISDEESELLGGIALAEYGLPGTSKLKNAVTSAFKTGAHTVFMKHHGLVVTGADRQEAYKRAMLLEDICKRNCKAQGTVNVLDDNTANKRDVILDEVRAKYPLADWVETQATISWSANNDKLFAQLDDMAQMIGKEIITVEPDPAEISVRFAQGYNALFVKGMGAIVYGMDEDDTEALGILVDKAAVSALQTKAYKVGGRLGWFDCKLMRFVYQQKYSKQKNG